MAETPSNKLNYQKPSSVYISGCHLVLASGKFKFGAEMAAEVRVFEGPHCITLAAEHATFALRKGRGR